MRRQPFLHLCSVASRLRRLAIPHMDTAFSSVFFFFSRSHFHCVCCHLTAGGLMDSFTLFGEAAMETRLLEKSLCEDRDNS